MKVYNTSMQENQAKQNHLITDPFDCRKWKSFNILPYFISVKLGVTLFYISGIGEDIWSRMVFPPLDELNKIVESHSHNILTKSYLLN